jgi:hypothetical protein
MNTFPKLHDATLETLELHWAEGIVRIRLSTGINGTGVVILEASGVLRAVCPRVLPWGQSDSVNEVKLEQVENGRLLSIEMQSGDQTGCRIASNDCQLIVPSELPANRK